MAVIPYFVAGYPSLEATRRQVLDAVAAGVDMIELGIPFSDPVADGPTIQAAVVESLSRGTRPVDVLRLVRRLREDGAEIPILAMTYANILHAPGFSTSARQLRIAGVDGAIVPDIPVEDSEAYARAMSREGLATIFLAAPSTTDARLRRILKRTSGFVYLVAAYGTTGARRSISPLVVPLLRRTRRANSAIYACVGFGVSKPKHVRRLRALGADGVIVGSALLERARSGASVRRFLVSLRAAA